MKNKPNRAPQSEARNKSRVVAFLRGLPKSCLTEFEVDAELADLVKQQGNKLAKRHGLEPWQGVALWLHNWIAVGLAHHNAA